MKNRSHYFQHTHTHTTHRFLKAWNVRSSQFSDDENDECWENEITRLDQPVSVGNTLEQCTPIPSNCIERLLGITLVSENGGALAGVIIAILIVLIALYFVSSTQDGISGSILNVVKEPNMSQLIFRFCQWFLALLTFSLWSSSENSDCCSGGNFLVAMGVCITSFLSCFVFDTLLHSLIRYSCGCTQCFSCFS